MNTFQHTTVLKNETINGVFFSSEYLEQQAHTKQLQYVDCTLGGGGHSVAFAQKFFDAKLHEHFKLHLIAFDQDQNAIMAAQNILTPLASLYTNFSFTIHHANFSMLKEVLQNTPNENKIGACIADLGFSSPRIDTPERGFAFSKEGPLDMRMNTDNKITASDLLLKLPEKELADLFFLYGEERKSKQIAKHIVAHRKQNKQSFLTTTSFAEYILQLFGNPRYYKIHPATKIFQALRIAVNQELSHLKTLLETMPHVLHLQGKCAFISFHSLEDRMVKQAMREWEKNHWGKEIPRGGIAPSDDECKANPRSRSARLRVFSKTH